MKRQVGVQESLKRRYRRDSIDRTTQELAEEFSTHQIESFLSKYTKLIERWDNRLTIDNLALAKRYIKSELRLVLCGSISRDGSDAKYYRAIFQGILPVSGADDDGRELDGLIFPRNVHNHAQVNADAYGPYRYDRLVFVQDVELVEARNGFVPSMVWLKSLDDAGSLLAGALYLFQSAGFKRIGGIADGEISVVPASPTGGNNIGCHQIECAAEIMNDIADDCAKTGGYFLKDADAKELISRLRVILGDDFIWCSAVKGGDFSLQITDVAFGPFDLYAGTAQWRHNILQCPIDARIKTSFPRKKPSGGATNWRGA